MDELKEKLELRCEELEIEELFWEHIRLQRRVDDLEGTLAHVLQGLADAQTREERLAAVELADVIPTIEVHRQRLVS